MFSQSFHRVSLYGLPTLPNSVRDKPLPYDLFKIRDKPLPYKLYSVRNKVTFKRQGVSHCPTSYYRYPLEGFFTPPPQSPKFTLNTF